MENTLEVKKKKKELHIKFSLPKNIIKKISRFNNHTKHLTIWSHKDMLSLDNICTHRRVAKMLLQTYP